MKKALITGITGQDGSYLAESIEKGYEVHGLKEDHHHLIQKELTIYIRTFSMKIKFLSSLWRFNR